MSDAGARVGSDRRRRRTPRSGRRTSTASGGASRRAGDGVCVPGGDRRTPCRPGPRL